MPSNLYHAYVQLQTQLFNIGTALCVIQVLKICTQNQSFHFLKFVTLVNWDNANQKTVDFRISWCVDLYTFLRYTW